MRRSNAWGKQKNLYYTDRFTLEHRGVTRSPKYRTGFFFFFTQSINQTLGKLGDFIKSFHQKIKNPPKSKLDLVPSSETHDPTSALPVSDEHSH